MPSAVARALGLACTILVLFVVPVTSVPLWVLLGGPAYAFDFPKLLLLVLAIVLAWGALLVALRSRSLLQVAEGVFGGAYGITTSALIIGSLLSTTLGPSNTAVALVGTDERLDGALPFAMMVHASQLMFALVRVRIISWHRVVLTAGLGAGVAACYAWLQLAGVHPWTLHPAISVGDGGNRAQEAFGNVGFATNYLAVIFVVGGIYSVKRYTQGSTWMLVVLAVVAFGVAAYAGRAGTIALFAAMGLTAAVFALRREYHKVGRIAGIALLPVLALVIASYVNPMIGARVDRFAVPTETDLNVQVRLSLWSIGARSLISNPFTARGPAGFAQEVWSMATDTEERLLIQAFVPAHLADHVVRDGRVFAAFDPATRTLYSGVANHDKAHNLFIDIGLQFGSVVLGLFVLWWSLALLRAARVLDRAPEIAAFIACYLIAQQFWFHTPMIDVGSYALLGAAVSTATECSAGDEHG